MRKHVAIIVGILVLVPMLASPVLADSGENDGFLLGGTAQPAQDPENAANDVIKIDTSLAPGQCAPPNFANCPFGTVSRKLNVKVDKLDHMLEFKSFFVAPKTCFAGSPRMTLLVDADGDGDFQQAPASPDFAAQGHVNPPAFAGCLPNVWRFDDLTDDLKRWETTPLVALTPLPCGPVGGAGTCTWDELEARVTATHPNHIVCTGFLVDDTFGAPGMNGIAYYDIISIGKATWEDHDDTAGRGFAGRCGPADGDDGDDDDDDDHDGDVDDADDEFDDNRRDD